MSALNQVRQQGWGVNVSKRAEDLAAVAMAFEFANEWYGVSIVGPLLRMQKQWAAHPGSLSQCVKHILSDLGNAQA